MTADKTGYDKSGALQQMTTEVPPLDLVADVYLGACLRGEPPTKHVAWYFRLSPSKASKLVMRARQGGYLSATPPGTAPVRRRRCPTCGAPPSRWSKPEASA